MCDISTGGSLAEYSIVDATQKIRSTDMETTESLLNAQENIVTE